MKGKKVQKNQKNTEDGITLIALIITVMVVAIIAGATLTTINIELLSNADNARERTILAELKEKVQFAIQAALTDAYNNGSRALSKSSLANPTIFGRMSDIEIEKMFSGMGYEVLFVTGEEVGPWNVKVDIFEATIDSSGKIENVDNTTD